ncbi:MAG: amidohydrolase [Clostridiales bacterium]|nr:amidohydrolase [Clostridiales bacterium]
MKLTDEERNTLYSAVDARRELILEAERHIWKNPETGYREWKTHEYLRGKYLELGYSLCEAGNIPGFYCDVDTGIPGPTVGVFGEMDALIVPGHPECDRETGAVHACGHNAQSAALLGIAAALTDKKVTEGLCGRIRLFAVPAEEMIELEYRSKLIEEGVISYYGGKQEFMKRGYLDGVDLAFMVHQGSGRGFSAGASSNGCMVKIWEFLGKSSHASDPRGANNALYAANLAMNAVNALRETFDDSRNIRFHPIITAGGESVNAIPDRVKIETYIRGATMQSMAEVNLRINRAAAAAAASMGCRLVIRDAPGYAPRCNDRGLNDILLDAARELLGDEAVRYSPRNSFGCSDMGDVSQVIPAVHPTIGGATGGAHTDAFRITDPELACVTGAKIQLAALRALLSGGGEAAYRVIEGSACPFGSMKEYFEFIDGFNFCGHSVFYGEDGSVTLRYKK